MDREIVCDKIVDVLYDFDALRCEYNTRWDRVDMLEIGDFVQNDKFKRTLDQNVLCFGLWELPVDLSELLILLVYDWLERFYLFI